MSKLDWSVAVCGLIVFYFLAGNHIRQAEAQKKDYTYLGTMPEVEHRASPTAGQEVVMSNGAVYLGVACNQLLVSEIMGDVKQCSYADGKTWFTSAEALCQDCLEDYSGGR